MAHLRSACIPVRLKVRFRVLGFKGLFEFHGIIGYILMEKKMETTGENEDSIGLYTDYRVYLGVILG